MTPAEVIAFSAEGKQANKRLKRKSTRALIATCVPECSNGYSPQGSVW